MVLGPGSGSGGKGDGSGSGGTGDGPGSGGAGDGPDGPGSGGAGGGSGIGPGCGGSGDGSGVDPIVCIADPFLPKLSVRAKYRAQELCPRNPARNRTRGGEPPPPA